MAQDLPNSDFPILHDRYGKTMVKLAQVRRRPDRHELSEVTVQVLLEGEFQKSFTESDNSMVVPTDTVKNTIYLLSQKNDVDPIENYGVILIRHFLKTYAHVKRVVVHIEEEPWTRMTVDGKQHHHAFSKRREYTRTADLVGDRSKISIKSGVKNFVVFKTTQSGFSNFHRCKFTSLPDVADRTFSTSIAAEWNYAPAKDPSKVKYNEIFRGVLKTLVEVFAGPADTGVFSASVQATLYDMCKLSLHRYQPLNDMWISMPNIHYFLFDTERFGLGKNNNRVLYKLDNPSGLIQARVGRNTKRSKL